MILGCIQHRPAAINHVVSQVHCIVSLNIFRHDEGWRHGGTPLSTRDSIAHLCRLQLRCVKCAEHMSGSRYMSEGFSRRRPKAK